MTDKLLRRIVAKGKARRAGKQSDAYRWLYAHHASMAAALATDPPEWRAIAEVLTAGGVRGGRSRPLTDRAVKRMWQRVCRDIAAEGVHRLTGVRPSASNRSRASVTWRPEQIPDQPQEPRGSGPLPAQSPSSPKEGMSIGQARLAALRQALNERSGR